MNTEYTNTVKQRALSKIIGALFEGTCIYSAAAQTRWGDAMEPDRRGIGILRHQLAVLASLLPDQDWDAIGGYIDQHIIPLIEEIGANCGHITLPYTTGTWGVRLSTAETMLTIVRMDNIPNPHGHVVDFHGQPVKVETSVYDVGEYGIRYKLTPLDTDICPFSIFFSWADITGGRVDELISKEVELCGS